LRVWGEENPVRALSEITGSMSGGSEGGVRSNGGGSSSIGGTKIYSSERSSFTT
jgi:hypothetical protein